LIGLFYTYQFIPVSFLAFQFNSSQCFLFLKAGQIGENGKESKVSLPNDTQDKAEQEVICSNPDDACGKTPLEELHSIASTSLLDDVAEHVAKFIRDGNFNYKLKIIYLHVTAPVGGSSLLINTL